MKENYVQASICHNCQEIIILRQLGNVWKLPYMPARQDKIEHKPTVIFSTMYDAKKVKSGTRKSTKNKIQFPLK